MVSGAASEETAKLSVKTQGHLLAAQRPLPRVTTATWAEVQVALASEPLSCNG